MCRIENVGQAELSYPQLVQLIRLAEQSNQLGLRGTLSLMLAAKIRPELMARAGISSDELASTGSVLVILPAYGVNRIAWAVSSPDSETPNRIGEATLNRSGEISNINWLSGERPGQFD